MNDIERAIEYLNGMRSFMQKRMVEVGDDKTLMKVRVEEIPDIDTAIAALQAQLDREREPDGWTRVEDRLPTEDDVASPELGVLAIHKASKKKYWHYRCVVDNPFDFIYWMPLPEPPKEERV